MTTAEPRRRAFTNGVKPIHAIVLVIFLLIRYTYGGVDLRARRSASENVETSNEHDHGWNEGSDDHQEHEEEGYQVFHVEFARVELPFIIALWIFVSSLAKIGMYTAKPGGPS